VCSVKISMALNLHVLFVVELVYIAKRERVKTYKTGRRYMNFKNSLIRISMLTTALVMNSAVSAAPMLWVGDSSGNLGTVDVATGAVNVIGSMGQRMTDIAFDPSGNLYSINSIQLFSIDKTNATPTLVGNLGASVNSLVFDSSGVLYAANNALYTVNVGTGAASRVGNGGC